MFTGKLEFSKRTKNLKVKGFRRKGKFVKSFRRRQKVGRKKVDKKRALAATSSIVAIGGIGYVALKSKSKAPVENSKQVEYPSEVPKPTSTVEDLKEDIQDLQSQKESATTEPSITTVVTETPPLKKKEKVKDSVYEKKALEYPEDVKPFKNPSKASLQEEVAFLRESLKTYGAKRHDVDLDKLTLAPKDYKGIAPYTEKDYRLTGAEVEALKLYTTGGGHRFMNGLSRGVDPETYGLSVNEVQRLNTYSNIVNHSLINNIPPVKLPSSENYFHRMAALDTQVLEKWLKEEKAPLFQDPALMSVSTNLVKPHYVSEKNWTEYSEETRVNTAMFNWKPPDWKQSSVYMRIRPDSRGQGESQAGYVQEFGVRDEYEAIYPKGTSFLVEGIKKRNKGSFEWYEVDLREVHPKFNKTQFSKAERKLLEFSKRTVNLKVKGFRRKGKFIKSFRRKQKVGRKKVDKKLVLGAGAALTAIGGVSYVALKTKGPEKVTQESKYSVRRGDSDGPSEVPFNPPDYVDPPIPVKSSIRDNAKTLGINEAEALRVNNHTNPWGESFGLTYAEKKGLDIYISSGYKDVNNYLRSERKTKNPKLEATADLIQSGLSKIPETKLESTDHFVDRMVKFDKDTLTKFKEGGVFKDMGFMSTAIEARNPGVDGLTYIKVRPDARGKGEIQGKYIGYPTLSVPWENEVLFPRGCSFMVEKVTVKKNRDNVEYTEIDLREIHPKFNKK